MRLLGAVVLLGLPLSAQVTIYSDLGETGDRAVRRLLEARLPALPLVLPWPAGGVTAAADGSLLLGVDAHELYRLGERLAPASSIDLEPPFSGPDGRYAITLLSPYVVAFNTQLVDLANPPGSWDDLLELQYQDRLIVGTPDAMPDLWDTWWGRELRRGNGERRAIAWLTTLDARIGSYAGSGDVVRQSLISEDASVGVLQRHLLEDATLEQVLLAGEVAAAGLGVAIVGTAPDPEAAVVHAVLVSAAFNRELADAMGLVAVPRPGEERAARTAADLDLLARLRPLQLDPGSRREWVRHWEESVRGRGRGMEDLSESLDLILGLLFLGFLVFVYTRIRKSEPRRGRTAKTASPD